jgi:hypothetical protein
MECEGGTFKDELSALPVSRGKLLAGKLDIRQKLLKDYPVRLCRRHSVCTGNRQKITTFLGPT